MADLERVTIAIEPELLAAFDRLLAASGHVNRSEGIRDLIRARLVEEELAGPAGGLEAIGTVTMVYDHRRRELANRLIEQGHHHAAAVLATLHVHLDHDRCLEVSALRGTPAELRHFAEHLLGMKGVEHGRLVITTARPGTGQVPPEPGRKGASAREKGAGGGTKGGAKDPSTKGRGTKGGGAKRGNAMDRGTKGGGESKGDGRAKGRAIAAVPRPRAVKRRRAAARSPR